MATGKYMCSASWCGFSKKAKEQLKDHPIDGLTIIECDVEKDNALCLGVQGFPTWKSCPGNSTDSALCTSMAGHAPPEKLVDFFAPTLQQ